MLYTVKQAHQYLNGAIGINRIREMMNTGELPAAMLGNKRVVAKVQLDKFVRNLNAIAEIEAEQKIKTRKFVS